MPTVKDMAGEVRSLTVSRDPVDPQSIQKSKSIGDQAVMDAVVIVLIAWAVLFALAWSLRSHNV